MTQEFKALEYASLLGTVPDNENPIFILSLTSKANLLAILKGELDVMALAKYELKNRGMNEQGKFIGF